MAVPRLLQSLWLLLLLLLASVGICLIGETTSSGIGYQIHSWDDLDELHQALVKGARAFKFDLHFADNATFCQQMAPIHRHHSDIDGDGDFGRVSHVLPDQRGCFLLSHDAPDLNTRYNTSQQLLDLIATHPIFRQQPQQQFLIALCFKFGGNQCDNSTRSNNWISLVDDFVDSANAIVQKFSLHIDFVLDGSGVAEATSNATWCLTQRWRPWPMTWQPGFNSLVSLTSDDSSLGYDRHAVLDAMILDVYDLPIVDPAYWIKYLKKRNFGKFPHSKWPWLVWEPDDQFSIMEVSKVYLESGFIHDAGFKFAINIDPVQFEVYSARRTNAAWNQQMVTMLLTSLRAPHVTVISREESAGVLLLNVFSSKSIIGHEKYHYQLSIADQILGTVKKGSVSSLPVADFTTSICSVSSARVNGSTDYVLITDCAGIYALYRLDASLTLLPVLSAKFSPKPGPISLSTATLVSVSQGTRLLAVEAFAPKTVTTCNLLLQTWEYIPGSGFLPLSTWSPENACVQHGIAVSSASIAIVESSNQLLQGAVVYSSSNNMIYAAIVDIAFASVPASAPLSVKLLINEGIASIPFAVDVGSSPDIAAIAHNGQVYLLEVHGDGFCFNNGKKNRQASPRVCSLQPTSTRHILNYNWGTLQGWKRHVLTGTPMSACSKNVLHGMFDEGDLPSVALFQFRGEIGMAEIHHGRPMLYDKGACGRADHFEGLVLDGWKLPTQHLDLT